MRPLLAAAATVACLMGALAFAQDPPAPAGFDSRVAVEALLDPARSDADMAALLTAHLRERIAAAHARAAADPSRKGLPAPAWGDVADHGWDVALLVRTPARRRSGDAAARAAALVTAYESLAAAERDGPLGKCLALAAADCGAAVESIDAVVEHVVADSDAPKRLVGVALASLERRPRFRTAPRLLQLLDDSWEAPYGLHARETYFPLRGLAFECLKRLGVPHETSREPKDGFRAAGPKQFARLVPGAVADAVSARLRAEAQASFDEALGVADQIPGDELQRALKQIAADESIPESRRERVRALLAKW